MNLKAMKRWKGLLCLLLLALVLRTAAAEVITPYDVRSRLQVGQLTVLELPGDTGARLEYVFTPAANSLYGVNLFEVSGEFRASAELWDQDTLLERGEGGNLLMSVRLSAGRTYTLKLFGTGTALLEISREALSRSFTRPMALEETYTKRIARSGDAHWYEISSEEECLALISATPRERGLRLRAWLFTEDGHLAGTAETLPSGTAVYSASLGEKTKYRVRVAAIGDVTGTYTMAMSTESGASMAESVKLSEDSLELNGREVAVLSASVFPEGSCGLLLLDSTDKDVASMDGEGYVLGGRPGNAVLTAYAWGGARSVCRVRVARVAVESVAFEQKALSLAVGETLHPLAVISPANATERSVRYFSEDENVASVSESGTIRGEAVGETYIVVESADAGLVDRCLVTVTEAVPRHRALLIGEQNYASTVEQPREGSVRSVSGVMSLLSTFSAGNDRWRVTTVMDASRDAALSRLRSVFSEAREDDISLIYITCHGFYRSGMTFFLMADGSTLAATDLERELRRLKGTFVIIADCCGSGGLIDRSAAPEDLLRGITQVFTGTSGGPVFAGSRYKVIASAYLEQDSYRVGFVREDGIEMATVFARALCDGGGWSMDENARAAMKADMDYDGSITLDELETYLSRRVMWYLRQIGPYVQTVCVYPEGDAFVLFSRENAE